MGHATLTKYRTLVHHFAIAPGQVRFAQEFDEASGESPTIDGVTISHQMWVELGSPATLTITIEPGDLLNR